MIKIKNTGKPFEIPPPEKNPETKPQGDPKEPVSPDENPGIIPEQQPFETPPNEIPVPNKQE